MLLLLFIGFNPAQAQYSGGPGRGDSAFTEASLFPQAQYSGGPGRGDFAFTEAPLFGLADYLDLLAALDAAVAAAGELTEADYTAESWAALQDALDLPQTSNAEVVAKTTAINDAMAALVTVGEREDQLFNDRFES